MQQECKLEFGLEEVQKFCSRKETVLYVRCLNNVKIGKDKSLKWCPQPDCPETVKKPCCCVNQAMCVCGNLMCWKCGEIMHQGRCKKSNGLSFFLWASKSNFAICPSCRARSIKDDGCNHMTCPQCKHVYCWICKKDLT